MEDSERNLQGAEGARGTLTNNLPEEAGGRLMHREGGDTPKGLSRMGKEGRKGKIRKRTHSPDEKGGVVAGRFEEVSLSY